MKWVRNVGRLPEDVKWVHVVARESAIEKLGDAQYARVYEMDRQLTWEPFTDSQMAEFKKRWKMLKNLTIGQAVLAEVHRTPQGRIYLVARKGTRLKSMLSRLDQGYSPHHARVKPKPAKPPRPKAKPKAAYLLARRVTITLPVWLLDAIDELPGSRSEVINEAVQRVYYPHKWSRMVKRTLK